MPKKKCDQEVDPGVVVHWRVMKIVPEDESLDA